MDSMTFIYLSILFICLSLTGLLFSASFANSNAKRAKHTHTHTRFCLCVSQLGPRLLWLASLSLSLFTARDTLYKRTVNHTDVHTNSSLLTPPKLCPPFTNGAQPHLYTVNQQVPVGGPCTFSNMKNSVYFSFCFCLVGSNRIKVFMKSLKLLFML